MPNIIFSILSLLSGGSPLINAEMRISGYISIRAAIQPGPLRPSMSKFRSIAFLTVEQEVGQSKSFFLDSLSHIANKLLFVLPRILALDAFFNLQVLSLLAEEFS